MFAKNKKRVSAFYQQTLGLVAEESESSHDLLRGNGYEVVIHSIPRKYAAEIKIAKPVQPRENTPIKPTFVVGDLEAARAAAKDRWLPQAARRSLALSRLHRAGRLGPRGKRRPVQTARVMPNPSTRTSRNVKRGALYFPLSSRLFGYLSVSFLVTCDDEAAVRQ
ncbi:MAG: hypothetical protein IPG91_19290 [Ideonella sp.]|nr:hypothetical protein [Ideonella sp.]